MIRFIQKFKYPYGKHQHQFEPSFLVVSDQCYDTLERRGAKENQLKESELDSRRILRMIIYERNALKLRFQNGLQILNE